MKEIIPMKHLQSNKLRCLSAQNIEKIIPNCYFGYSGHA